MVKFSKHTDICFSLTAFFFFCLTASYGSAQDISISPEYAKNFVRTASTILAPVYGPLAEHIVSEFDLAEKEGIGIDIGGGPGNLVIELCKRTRRIHLINVDINPSFSPYVSKAAEEAGVGERVSTMLADAHDLPFRDNYADIIVSRASFQFWDDKLQAFSEIYRVLKPGGIAYIGRGFSDNLPVNIARRIRASQRESGRIPEYDVIKTSQELEHIMKSLGIREYRIQIPRPPGSEGINYGIWLEFHKPGHKKSLSTDTQPTGVVNMNSRLHLNRWLITIR